MAKTPRPAGGTDDPEDPDEPRNQPKDDPRPVMPGIRKPVNERKSAYGRPKNHNSKTARRERAGRWFLWTTRALNVARTLVEIARAVADILDGTWIS